MHNAHSAPDTASLALSRYLNQAGRRILWFKLARGAAFALATCLVGLLICGFFAGPNLSWLAFSLCWLGLGLATILACAVGIGRLDELRGDRQSLLLASFDPELSARAHSAAALLRAPNGSQELIAAHASRVAHELTAIPVARTVARPAHFASMSLTALALAALATLFMAHNERAASGLHALFHPAATDDHGLAVGLWVSRLKVELKLPEKVEPRQQVQENPVLLDVPESTQLTFIVRPRFAVDRAVLKVGEQTLPMRLDKEGSYRVTLTAVQSGDLAFTALQGEQWIRDSVARSLAVAEDKAPVIELDAPLQDVSAAPDEPVPFVFRVSDDHGLSSLDLVVQLGPGRERRVHLASFDAENPRDSYASSTDVIPAAFGAHAGQTLAVWIEARDRDGYGGTHVGRSPVRTISVGEQHEGQSAPVELLERTRDLTLDTLAERLTLPLADSTSDAKTRERQLNRSTRTLVRALEALATAYVEGTADQATSSLLRDMGRRLSRFAREETAAVEAANTREIRKLDDSAVAELEDDTLWLSDLIGRAKLANAEHSLERLAATRERMRDLLKQLRKSQDPARKAELMAEIARARAELTELAQKLAQVRNDVPGDFVNHEALNAKTSEDPLENLEAALARNDLDAAEKAMAALDQQLEGLGKGLEEGSEAYADARFGPRNAAIEQARSELSEIERAQKQVASETGRLADKSRAQRTQDGAFKAEADRLAQEADALEQRARALDPSRGQGMSSESQASAAQRLRDARDALRQGDAQEARAMAQRAASDLGGAAADMMMDSRMYPGPDGSRMETARKTGQLARDVAQFSEQVDKSLPQESQELSPEDSQGLKKQAPQQRDVGEQANKLAQSMRDQGPPSLSERIGRATRAMRGAADALEQGDARQAQAGQREALERLAELNEELSRQERAGRSGQRGQEGGSERGSNEKVAIPGQSDDARRAELRRRVLDARRADAPDSFARSVERYYQEILR